MGEFSSGGDGRVFTGLSRDPAADQTKVEAGATDKASMRFTMVELDELVGQKLQVWPTRWQEVRTFRLANS